MRIPSAPLLASLLLAATCLTSPAPSAPHWRLQEAAGTATPQATTEARTNGPVDGYGLVSCQGEPCRIPAASLPLHVFSRDSQRQPLVRRAAEVWNQASHQFQSQDVVVVDATPTASSVEIDWTGHDMPTRSVGATSIEQRGQHLEVDRICMRPSHASDDDVTQTLAHEMGHALGLDHSRDPNDLMFRAIHPGSTPSLSQRDMTVFQWLYTRNQTVPIVPVKPEA